MKLDNQIGLYCKSMGKIFRVRHIAKTDDEANAFMASHRDTATIACCSQTGLVFIADIYQVKVPSTVLPD